MNYVHCKVEQDVDQLYIIPQLIRDASMYHYSSFNLTPQFKES